MHENLQSIFAPKEHAESQTEGSGLHYCAHIMLPCTTDAILDLVLDCLFILANSSTGRKELRLNYIVTFPTSRSIFVNLFNSIQS